SGAGWCMGGLRRGRVDAASTPISAIRCPTGSPVAVLGSGPVRRPAVDADALSETLNGVARGDAAAIDRLLPVVYQELRLLAARYLRGERPGHTLQPTALPPEVSLTPPTRDE